MTLTNQIEIRSSGVNGGYLGDNGGRMSQILTDMTFLTAPLSLEREAGWKMFDLTKFHMTQCI